MNALNHRVGGKQFAQGFRLRPAANPPRRRIVPGIHQQRHGAPGVVARAPARNHPVKPLDNPKFANISNQHCPAIIADAPAPGRKPAAIIGIPGLVTVAG